ncbi:MAG: hypothetical protein IJZ85_10480 [Lachnospiraceae bacterium]|nr:hypothetical protein [Lachnospiraceae bacterium]
MDNYINVDQNMIVNTTIDDVAVEWHDVRKSPISLHGLYEPESEPFFYRIPLDVAAATSGGVDRLNRECTGGRVRFSTDSPYIAVRATYRAVGRSSHLTLVSTSGFDLYIDGEYGSRYVKEFRMPYDMVDCYEQIIYLDSDTFRSYTINMPVHACVESMEIGLKPGARLDAARPYRDIKPVVIYGSSIVHGTAASRPGNIYPAVISRKLNVDVRNLGFSGNAKGEKVLVDWMATLPMSVFVCDYDYNAPTVEHLEQTHYAMYETIREKNPELPYIMISRPNYWTSIRNQEEILQRRDVVMYSYLAARKNGDKYVYFIDGMSFFGGENQYEYTLDGVHPNDAGFLRMGDCIGTVIRHVLEKAGESF